MLRGLRYISAVLTISKDSRFQSECRGATGEMSTQRYAKGTLDSHLILRSNHAASTLILVLLHHIEILKSNHLPKCCSAGMPKLVSQTLLRTLVTGLIVQHGEPARDATSKTLEMNSEHPVFQTRKMHFAVSRRRLICVQHFSGKPHPAITPRTSVVTLRCELVNGPMNQKSWILVIWYYYSNSPPRGL